MASSHVSLALGLAYSERKLKKTTFMASYLPVIYRASWLHSCVLSCWVCQCDSSISWIIDRLIQSELASCSEGLEEENIQCKTKRWQESIRGLYQGIASEDVLLCILKRPYEEQNL